MGNMRDAWSNSSYLSDEVKKRMDAEFEGGRENPNEPIGAQERHLAAPQTPAQKLNYLMELAHVPKIFFGADIETNCQIFNKEPDKAVALQRATEMALEGCIPGRSQNRFSIMLTGSFGQGKTWLGTAVFKELLAQIGEGGRWTTFSAMIRDIQEAYSGGETKRRIDQYAQAKVLLLDDVGDLEIKKETEDRQRLFFEIIDHRNSWSLPTIMTSNLIAPAHFKERFGERTFNRLYEMSAFLPMAGRNFRIHPPEATNV